MTRPEIDDGMWAAIRECAAYGFDDRPEINDHMKPSKFAADEPYTIFQIAIPERVAKGLLASFSDLRAAAKEESLDERSEQTQT